MASFKILSLDGGGSWALIQVRVLKDIYGDIRGHELLRKFDLAIANSGGSLVLAALCVDLKLSEVQDIFNNSEKRQAVFSSLTRWERLKNFFALFSKGLDFGPRYHTGRKWEGLGSVLRGSDHLLKEGKITKAIVDTYINELPTIIGKPEMKIIVVGFDYFKERANFFRSDTNSISNRFNGGKFFQITLLDAIHTSSNAPVNYFHTPAYITLDLLNSNPQDKRRSWYWDGAIGGFNNPVLAGVIEAVTNQYSPTNDYCILSIGTGTGSRAVLTEYKESTHPDHRKTYEKNKKNPLAVTDADYDFFKDLKRLATSILGDPPDSATFIAYAMLDPTLKPTSNIVRINPCYSPEKNDENVYEIPSIYKLDPNGHKKFMALLDLDMDAVKDEEVALLTDLCDKFINNITGGSSGLSNQLIRGDYTSADVLGFRTYPEAKARWQELTGGPV